MKVAIVGCSGYIAGFLLRGVQGSALVESVLKIDKSDNADIAILNLESPESFDYSKLNGIDYIVFTAAISSPDQCAEDFDFCWDVNVTGTKYFIQNALDRKCRVLFFSSDAVFGDRPCTVYSEESETCPETCYGEMKKAIEDEFKEQSNFKSVRLSYVVSAMDRFVSYCLHCIETGETAEIFHPFYRNCISVSDVVGVVLWFIGHWDKYEAYCFNVAGNELVSRVRIADEINRIFDNRLKYDILNPGENFYKNRPRITQMESIYNRRYKITEEMNFSERIQKELEDVKI